MGIKPCGGSILKFSSLVFIFAFIFFKYRQTSITNINGFATDDFTPVREAFLANFRDGWERSGAALAVYYRGELVVDLYGGYADLDAKREWKKDTMSVAFSSTKAVSALCIAKLVEEGRLNYDTLITDFWPEFGQNGKENITVQWIMSHMAGLAYTDSNISYEDALDPKRISVIFETQKPHWPAGTAVGYHALTYGWLVDQIIRRVDKAHRSLGEYYREEIQSIHGIDFHIGLNLSHAHRVARIITASIPDRIEEFFHDPYAVPYLRILRDFVANGPLKRTSENCNWLRFIREMTLNNPDYYTLEQGAVLGIGTAKELARLFMLTAAGKIINETTLSIISKPYVRSRDVIITVDVPRGQGFTHTEVTFDNRTYTYIGHSGFGGQNVKFDIENQVSFAYLSNGLKGGFGDSVRTYVRLSKSIFETIDNIRNKQ